jgi:hypothetical protein
LEAPQSPTKLKIQRRQRSVKVLSLIAIVAGIGSAFGIVAVAYQPLTRAQPVVGTVSNFHADGRHVEGRLGQLATGPNKASPEVPQQKATRNEVPPAAAQALKMATRYEVPPQKAVVGEASRHPVARQDGMQVPASVPVQSEASTWASNAILIHSLADQVRLGSLSQQDFARMRLSMAKGTMAGAPNSTAAKQMPAVDLLLSIHMLLEKAQKLGFLLHSGQEIYMLLDRTNVQAAAVGRVVQTVLCKPPCLQAKVVVQPLSGHFEVGASTGVIATQLARSMHGNNLSTEEQLASLHAKFLDGPAVNIAYISAAKALDIQSHTMTSTVLGSEKSKVRHTSSAWRNGLEVWQRQKARLSSKFESTRRKRNIL